MVEKVAELPRSRRPSVIALLFGIWALVAPIGYSAGMLSADGDLARHIVLGKHILSHGVAFPDVFSNTKPGAEFVAYEWLSEVILAGVHAFGGLAAVAILAGLLIASSVALVAVYLRGKLETAGILVLGTLTTLFTYPHWVARPHLFSFLALSVLLLLTDLTPSWKRHLSLLGLFSLWANLHPGFIYGLAVWFAFLLGDCVDHRTPERWRRNGLSAFFASIGTFITPLGWTLHKSILGHLGDTRAFQLVDEFQPLSAFSPYGALFFFTLGSLIWILAAGSRRPGLSVLMPFFASLFAAFVAVRNVPLFGLFAFPLLIRSMSDVIHHWHWRPLEKPRRVMAEDDAGARTVPYVAVVLVILGILGSTSGRIGSFQIIDDSFSSEAFPVEAVHLAREAGLSSHTLFNEYRWGGYLLFAWPEQTIFIDGMANFFGSELMEEYLSVLLTQEGWKDTILERGIDLFIIPTDSRLSQEVRKLPGWFVWFEDPMASVLLYEGTSKEDT